MNILFISLIREVKSLWWRSQRTHYTWECRSNRVGICVTRSSIISICRRWRSACSLASSRRRDDRISRSLSCSCLVYAFIASMPDRESYGMRSIRIYRFDSAYLAADLRALHAGFRPISVSLSFSICSRRFSSIRSRISRSSFSLRRVCDRHLRVWIPLWLKQSEICGRYLKN